VKPEDLDPQLLRARSYDDVAEVYERVNAPVFFDAPARALVEFAALARGERALDVGTGTGAVARAALPLLGERGVVAIDPSIAMLMAGRRAGVEHAAVACLPDLPFVSESFDAVMSAFVMTHVDDPDAAVRDIHRVLRAGGRIVLSAWSPSDDEYSTTWSGVAHEFVDAAELNAAALRVLPGEPRFAKREGLADLLDANGFASVRTEVLSFRFTLNVDQMAESREVNAGGRALRALLSDDAWRSFQRRVRDVLGKKFPSGIIFNRDVFFAVSSRP
jgi:ubiquinone/menaquinone biosynthesis C-methylase UbiE